MQTYDARLGSAVSVVAVAAPITKYHGERLAVLPTPYIQPVVQWWCDPYRQGSFIPAKGPSKTKGKIGD